MKFSTSVAVALAPMALARTVRRSNEAAVEKRSNHVVEVPLPHPAMQTGSSEKIVIIWANIGGEHETTTYNEKVTVTQTIVQTAPAAHPTAPVHPPPAEAAPVHPPPAEAAPPAHPPAEAAPPVHPPPAEVSPPPAAEHPPAAMATHTVTVGGPGGLIYQPDQLTNVPVGDMIIFEFLQQNHTVSESLFDTPCAPKEGGMNSGFQFPNPNNTVVPPPQVALQVMSPDPMWFYCAQGNHCGQGMVFSLNPNAEKTHAMFQEKAIAQNGDGEASPITGGEPAPAPEAPPAEGEAPAAPAPDAPEAAPPAAPPPGMAPGQGTVQPDGSCNCMAVCSFNGFPSASQGVGATGGWGSSMPYEMAGIARRK